MLRSEDGAAPVLVVVSNRGELPRTVADGAGRPGAVLVTRRSADGRAAPAREALGADHVVTAGDDEVDLVRRSPPCTSAGCGSCCPKADPGLFGSLLQAEVVDEVDLTWAPVVVGGDQARILSGPDLRVPLTPMTLVEEDGTLLGRWRVGRR